MDRQTISAVTKKLSEDRPLIQGIGKFADALETPHGDLYQWNRQYNIGNTTGYDFITELLYSWIGRNEIGVATLNNLKSILKTHNFHSAADSLKTLDVTPEQNALLSDSTTRMDVAKLLVEDPRLVNNWKDFSKLILEVPEYEVLQWNKQVNREILTLPELMNNILADWVSRNDSSSVSDLAKLLRKSQYGTLADRLQAYRKK